VPTAVKGAEVEGAANKQQIAANIFIRVEKPVKWYKAKTTRKILGAKVTKYGTGNKQSTCL